MSKKIIIGLASLVILGGGGYFFAETVNSQVETITSQKLDEYGIKHGAIDYSIFTQTLKISDVEGTYSEKEKNTSITSFAKEITIKGISKDVINNNSFDSNLICDELSLTDYKNTFSLYGNEELVTNIGNVTITSPTLNIRELIKLHNTERFSEKYFQTILDFRHDGITYNNINFDIKKASENLAQLTIESLSFAPAESEKSTVTYNNATFNSEPLKLEIEKFNITDISIPNAKNLAKITNLAINLNKMEISEANEDSIQALTEYERLSNELLFELTQITQIPFASSNIENVKIFPKNQLATFNTPITLDKFEVIINEKDEILTIDSALGKILIPAEYFTILPVGGINTIIKQKFNNGFALSATNHREFNKNTKILTDNNSLTIDQLSNLNIKIVATLPTQDYTLIFLGSETFNSYLTPEHISNSIEINEIDLTYNDQGLINFSQNLVENIYGINKDVQKQLLTNELQQIKSFLMTTDDISKQNQDINLLIEKTLEFLVQDKKEFNANIKFNTPYTPSQLNTLDYPDMTLTISTK